MFRGNEPVIIDFGYCDNVRGKKPNMYYNVGSPSYMSPEAYKSCQYSQKSDVWALGVIFFEMLMGHTLDFGMDIKGFFQEIEKPGGLKFSNKISKTSQMLLSLMLKGNPNERIGVANLKSPI